MRLFFGILCFCLSALGLFFIAFPSGNTLEKKCEKIEILKDAVPSTIGGMKSKDLPLGNTESVSKAAVDILNVSDWMNREYTTKDGKTFTLYISYWLPNAEETFNASVHTPDRCWVMNGWKNLDEKKRSDDILETNGKKLFPAYYRELTFLIGENGITKRNVWFWFIVDGKRYNYITSDTFTPNPYLYIKNVISRLKKFYPEKYFIRIDSSYPLEDFLKDDDFNSLLSKLGDLVLFPKDNGGDK